MIKTVKNRIYLLIITFISIIILHTVPSIHNILIKEASASYGIETVELTRALNDNVDLYLYINDFSYDIHYILKSSNSKIVNIVDNEPRTQALGTATVTIYQPVKGGKNKKIALLKITVVPTQLSKKEYNTSINSPISLLKYQNYKAKYSYKTTNSNIAYIQEDGCIVGKKAGTVYITVTEKYKGKTTVIGKAKVNVIQAYIPEKNMKIGIWNGNPEAYNYFKIEYESVWSIYTYVSDNPKIVKVDKETGFFYGLKYGKAAINVYETYPDKKQRKVGSLTVEVIHAKVVPDDAAENIYVNHEYPIIFGLNGFDNIADILYYNSKATYTFESADTSIITIVPDYEDKLNHIKAVNVGETTIIIYEEYKGTKIEIGRINLTVKEPTLTGIEFYIGIDDYLGTLRTGKDYSRWHLIDFVEYNPFFINGIPPVTFSSSNEDIVKVVDGYLVPVAKGLATITAVCGNYTAEFKVTVI